MQYNRKIIHIDMDCFYAAVECLDNPALWVCLLLLGTTQNEVLCLQPVMKRVVMVYILHNPYVWLSGCVQICIL